MRYETMIRKGERDDGSAETNLLEPGLAVFKRL